jgi:hypothetical protein
METIGSITAIEGRVTGIDADGAVRVLRVGDPVHADQTLITALGAEVVLQLRCGSSLRVGAGRVVVLDADVYEVDDSVDDGSLRLTDVQCVLEGLSAARRSVA